MATSPTKVDIRSSYDEEVAKQYGASSLEDLYKNLLLPSAQTVASQYASQYYAGEQQKAAEVASYDISKAYANYLKQQRNVMNTAQYETGHKEELYSALQESFKGAESQARAAESQALQTAAEKASDIYAKTYKTESAAAKSLYDTLMKDVENKTALFKAVESKLLDTTTLENLGLKSGYTTAAGENVKFNIYDTSDGEFKFSDYGIDAVSRLLSSEDFQHYLEKEGLLEYYQTNPLQLNEALFGVTDTEYRLSEESKALSNQRLFGTEGYIDTISMPEQLNIGNWRGKFKETEYSTAVDNASEYAKELGLSDEDSTKALLNYFTTEANDKGESMVVRKVYQQLIDEIGAETMSITELMNLLRSKFESTQPLDANSFEQVYPKLTSSLKEYAKTKYAKK